MAERAAIVTGASSGIGFAIARMLLDEGWAVTVAGRRPDKLEAAVSQLDGGDRVASRGGQHGRRGDRAGARRRPP